jgi:translation initiation factor 2B subunit (eIF-2B alpha/beta/delta family)
MVAVDISPEITSLIDEIENDRIHGASQLARQAASALKVAAEHSRAGSAEQLLLELREVGTRLMSTRPAMAPIFNIVTRLLKAISEKAAEMDLASIWRLTISKVDEEIENSLQAIARIARYSSELIADGDRVMTHSYSSTVVAALKEIFTKHGHIEVITTRSGPGGTGERIAQQLGSHGIPVTLIDDADIGLYISKMNKVMVGADRVCADGKVVNGTGTHQLALTAKKANIPFYVLGETLKFDSRVRGDEVDLENNLFDITPPNLITAVVTENGLLTPEEVVSYMKTVS